MTNVLIVTAGQFRNPMALFILVISNNRLFHRIYSQVYIRWPTLPAKEAAGSLERLFTPVDTKQINAQSQ